MDGCALVSTNAGWNLAIGAFPRATGRFETLKSSDGCREVTGQVQQDRCWFAYGVEHVRRAPLRWLGLVPKKLGYTFDHESFAVEYLRQARPEEWPEARRVRVRELVTTFHCALLGLAALGCIGFTRRGRGARVQGALAMAALALAAWGATADAPTFWPLAVFASVVPWLPLPGAPPVTPALKMMVALLGSTALTHAVFFGEDRYHVVVTPVLAVLAAGAVRRSESCSGTRWHTPAGAYPGKNGPLPMARPMLDDRTMRVLSSAILATSLSLAALVAPRDAYACGVFTPPDGNAPVTDHKLIYTISKTGSVLYDQVKYTGNPAGFAWVLPVKGTVKVGLSSDALFEALDGFTASQVKEPAVPGCKPAPAQNDGVGRGPFDAGFGGGVTVKERETVGPYDVVQLSATNANALTDWLTQNGFAIPQDVAPLFAEYVAQQFDFVAMKLTPKAGVELMRPVRISMNGASTQMPLRPIAAGTGASVGITLYVVGEGFYEPKNFPFFTVLSDEITWDFATKTSDFDRLRAQKEAALAGAGFELESQTTVDTWFLQRAIDDSPSYRASPDGPVDLKLVEEEVSILGGGRSPLKVSRLRGTLSRAALSKDLELQPSASQAGISEVRQPTKYANVPAQCPQGWEPDPKLGGGCSAGGGGGNGSVAMLGLVGLAALAGHRLRRRTGS
jgi:MYXO-CTERM domain-containing protein